MLRYLPVRRVHARQVLDSRGNPTVEVEVTVGEGVIGINGYTGRAIVPSGASTGKFEAVELRDGEKGCYTGLGVRKAVENVNTKLAEAILGENALDQSYIDKKIIETDGSIPGSSKGGSSSSPRSFISVSWRLPYQTDACTDDEYLKWGCLCYYNDTRQNPL